MPTISDFSKVSLLLPMSGANNGTVFTDMGRNKLVVSRFGNAKTVTTASKFYGSSGYFDGTGDYLTVPHSSSFSASGSGVTVSGWVNPQSTSALKMIASKRTPLAATEWSFLMTPGGAIALVAWNSASTVVLNFASTTSIPPAAWTHVEAGISSTSAYIFINGVLEATATPSGAIGANSEPVHIGRDPSNTARDWIGHMQDIAIYSDGPLHTSDFTPPEKLVGQISGTVRDKDGVPTQRKLFAVPRSYLGVVTAQTESDPTTGIYSMTVANTEHCVICLDDDAGTLERDMIHRALPV